jgi:hypothetical protein
MHHEIEAAPGLRRAREHGVDGRGLRDVAMAQHLRADLLRQRLDPLLDRLTLVAETDLGAIGATGFGDAEGQRAVVSDPQDHAALAAHQIRGCRHEASTGRDLAVASYDMGIRGLTRMGRGALKPEKLSNCAACAALSPSDGGI